MGSKSSFKFSNIYATPEIHFVWLIWSMTSSGYIFNCLSRWAGKEKMPHQKGVIDIQSTPKRKSYIYDSHIYLSPFLWLYWDIFLPKILLKDAFRVRIEGNAHERPCKKTLVYWDKICFKFFVHHPILNTCANNVRKHILWSKQTCYQEATPTWDIKCSPQSIFAK